MGTAVRLTISILLFIVVLFLGVIFTPQLSAFLNQFPGNFSYTSGNSTVQVPLLASIVASLVLTVVVNVISIPFRRRQP